MGWLSFLQGQVMGLDTAPLIYFIEQLVLKHLLRRSLLIFSGDRKFSVLPDVGGMEC
jgi:hypothetical protein